MPGNGQYFMKIWIYTGNMSWKKKVLMRSQVLWKTQVTTVPGHRSKSFSAFHSPHSAGPNWLSWWLLTLLPVCLPTQSPCTAHDASKWWTSSPHRWPSAGSRWATTWPAATATTSRCSTAPRWEARSRPGRRCATTPRAGTLSTPSTTWRHLPTWVSSWSYVIQRESWRVKSSSFRLTRMVSADPPAHSCSSPTVLYIHQPW